MCIISWCNSGHGDIRRSQRCVVGGCNRLLTAGSRSKRHAWRVLWRKVKKERKRLFECSARVVHVPYDPYTYSQNFDQGSLWTDPDFLSRSFSARFAAPSSLRREAIKDASEICPGLCSLNFVYTSGSNLINAKGKCTEPVSSNFFVNKFQSSKAFTNHFYSILKKETEFTLPLCKTLGFAFQGCVSKLTFSSFNFSGVKLTFQSNFTVVSKFATLLLRSH
ncbi:hypothetical protein RJ641_024184 [Dillenia turbinata]|uniref:Uncharacterized protein n=1 Tax=Dillenia turbinata TaxID=194707 RepID=A0AAN8YT73_9MAGN